ncbi:MAG TPA: immunoglobulin domain-containing protein, partial [Candidatus Sulfotelmatobacter sp.]|nr:immunoglobulin domain-containing protein [Candidatus Sulfotelmatobacter sp.]
MLDEVALYNRVLSASEIAAIHAAGSAGKCKTTPDPAIITQPHNQNVIVGGNAAFTVTATGTAPLSYQWLRNGLFLSNGGTISGATSSALTLANVQPADAGNYTVIVSNAIGTSVTSAVAVLTVLGPPVIIAQPQSRTNLAGTTASFSVGVTGSAPLSFQWRSNGVNLANSARISGSTTATLSIASVQPADAADYSVLVTNAAGAIASVVATLTVRVPPTITTPPASRNVNAGTDISFSTTAAGTQPLSYQWLFNASPLVDGAQLSGTTTPTLWVTNAQPANQGSYAVVVTNLAGAVTSAVATLTLIVPGSCSAPPAGLVSWWPADGNANDIAGSSNGSLQGGATAVASGLVAQAFGFNGATAFVQIPDSPALRPTNFTVEAWVLFTSLNSSGNSPAGQQYIVFKQNTRNSYFEGIYLGKERRTGGDVFSFGVSSASGQFVGIDSSPIIATGVWYHVAGVRGPNFLQLYLNGVLVGQVSVSFPQNYGTLPLYFGTSGQSYWDHKLAGLLDEVALYNRVLSASEIAAIHAAGSAGKCKTAQPPLVTVPPQNQSVVAGGNATFTVTATGTTPLSYQWLRDGLFLSNGGTISGATSSALSLANVQLSDSGAAFQTIVTNSLGAVTSAVAVLTVTPVPTPPTITVQPASHLLVVGSTTSFNVAATGTAPLTYQWQRNGSNLSNGGRISGATSATLTLANVQTTDAGNYQVVVSNPGGSIT